MLFSGLGAVICWCQRRIWMTDLLVMINVLKSSDRLKQEIKYT